MPLPEEISSHMPEDIRGHESLASFNDLGGLAKSYIETKQMVGRSIQVPAKDSRPEDVERWAGEAGAKIKDYGYTIAKLGDSAPEKPEAYEFKLDGVDDAAIKSDVSFNEFRNVAHKMGLSNAKANELITWYAKDLLPKLSESAKANAIQMIEDPGAVEKILGDRFKGETKQTVELRDKAIQSLSANIPDLRDFLEGTAPNGNAWMANKNHPAMVALLSQVAKLQFQDFGGAEVGLQASDNLGNVDTQIADMRANKDGLPEEELGRRLESLYKKKAVLLKMEGKGAR